MENDTVLKLYTIFHLNLAYSSIEEERFVEVVEQCYWPLLRLALQDGVPIGIEASGYTIEKIAAIDPQWISTLCKSMKDGICEFVGSGYAQVIGPLVPSELNEWNQKLGIEVYEKYLGVRPKIALVNEMAYSSGLIEIYLNSGYKALIMEWNNPYAFHTKWDKRWRYYPQIACDNHGNSIPVIWNDAIVFQQFQRYAHAENDISEYLAFLRGIVSDEVKYLSIYGNDAEVFDFRPSRFHTEARLREGSEWGRISHLFRILKNDTGYEFILPSEVLGHLDESLAGNRLCLEIAQQPIPVKKQKKYNITRWAVTGVNDRKINTKCYQIYSYLCNPDNDIDKAQLKTYWKELCYLWSSDFRTHIEKKRWQVFKIELDSLQKQMECFAKKNVVSVKNNKPHENISSRCKPIIEEHNSRIKIKANSIEIILNAKKGLTVVSLLFGSVYRKPLIGTIPHGFYDDISFGADYFTGHTIIEEVGRRKVTDLNDVNPVLSEGQDKGEEYISAKCFMEDNLGSIEKEVRVFLDEPRVTIYYHFEISPANPASIRTGIVTFLPGSFERETLFYKTTNGGKYPEKFKINNSSLNHAESVNRMISASHCLVTDGWIEIGDRKKYVRISTDKAKLYSVPMIDCRETRNSYFLRCYHTIQEIDETSCGGQNIDGQIQFNITAAII